MMDETAELDPTHETFRECERVVDAKYLDEVRIQAKQFSTKRLSCRSGLAEDAIRRFKNGKNSIRPRTLKKLTRAIHDLQNKILQN
jgi:DNA-binding Xre family transcriptional regulator